MLFDDMLEGLNRDNFSGWKPDHKFLLYMARRLSDELDGHDFLPKYIEKIQKKVMFETEEEKQSPH